MQIINILLKETIDLEMLDEFRLPWDRGTVVSFEGRHPSLKDWKPSDLKADGSRSYTLGVYGEFCCGQPALLVREIDSASDSLAAPAQASPTGDSR